MKVSILSADPVGVLHANEAMNGLVAKFKADWDAIKVKLGKTSMVNVTKYLLNCLDSLITCANIVLVNVGGADKKATVLNAASVIYDYIVMQALPFWLKPFSGKIKVFIIDTVMSISIDWIVSKYNNGVWTPPVVAPPVPPAS